MQGNFPDAAQDLLWQSDPSTKMTVNWVDLHTDPSLDLHFRRVGETAWSKQTRAKLDKATANAAALDPDFALLVGDLAYANGVSSNRWVEWLKSWTVPAVAPDGRLIPMIVGIGNHEVKGGYDGALDFGDYLSIVLLDTAHTNPVAGAQAEWLKGDLAARKSKQFVFVAYHYPAYGTTKAAKEGTPLDKPVSIDIRQHWMPSWEKYGVSAVFENDHHN